MNDVMSPGNSFDNPGSSAGAKTGPPDDSSFVALSQLASFGLFLVLGIVLYVTRGHFSYPGLGLLTGGFLFFVYSMGGHQRLERLKLGGDRPELFFMSMTVIGAVLLWIDPRLLYPTSVRPFEALRDTLKAAWLLAVGLAVLSLKVRPAYRRALGFGLAGVALLLLLARWFVLAASPFPHIDVFVCNSQACDFLLQGLNPYAQTYMDVYRGAYDYQPGFGYFPACLFALLPFRWLGDIRIASIAADAATMVLFVFLARRVAPGRSGGVWAGLAWLAFPASLFVLEQAWVDPLLVPLLAAMAFALHERRWAVAGGLLGTLMGVKQYGLLLAPLAAVLALRQAGGRGVLRGALGCTAAFVIWTLPFALMDFRSFWAQTIGTLVARSPRLDALTLIALLGRALERPVPGWVMVLATLLGVAGAAFWLYRRQAPDVRDWAASAVVAYGVTFLLGKQAFCNYYYFLAALVLIHTLLGFLTGNRASDDGISPLT